MSNSSLTATVLLITAIIGASSAHAVRIKLTCRESISKEPLFKYHEGSAVKSQNGTTSHKLGDGRDGEVYRNSAVSGEFITKVYKFSKDRDHDIETLKMLKQHESQTGFLIPEVTAVGEKKLVMDDIKGQSVRELLDDTSISDHMKLRIVSAVIKSNEMLSQFIAKRYDVPIIEVTNFNQEIKIKGKTIMIDKVFYFVPDYVKFNVHLDDILVEHKTGELYLINP